MSSHSFSKIDQKEYLKKYLSGDKGKKKKKDKKHKKSSKDSAKVRIIDDDVHHLDTELHIDEELLLTGDDAPQIVGEYIEELPADRKVPKWKSIVIKDEPEDNERRPARKYDDEVRIKKEFCASENRTRTPDISPNRRKDHRRKSSSSPPRRVHKSPTRTFKRDNPFRKNTDSNDSFKRDNPFRKNTESNDSFRRDNPFRKTTDSNESSDRWPKIKTEPLSPHHDNYSGYKSRDSFNASSSRRRTNSDQSPPRRKQNSSSRAISPTRKPRRSEQTPPRKEIHPNRMKNLQTPDNSPVRRTRNASHSPPKMKRHVNRSPDISPTRRSRNSRQSPIRKKHGTPPDNSPRRRRNGSYDQSPARKYKNSENRTFSRPGKNGPEQKKSRGRSPDQSPPRQRQTTSQYRHRRNSDQSPPRDRRRRYSSDASPPRKIKQRMETPGNSPPRKSRKASDPSPAHKRRNSDQSPPRRQRKPSLDARVKQEKLTRDLTPRPARQSRWEKQDCDKSQSPPPTHKPKPGKTLEGKKAGLQNAQALQKETKERRRREDVLFETMSSDISGRNAEVQVRSTGRKGRRAREAAEEDPEERRRKEEYEEKKKQQYDRWGKGLKQIEDHKNRMIQQEYESSKPLARYANDEDLERHLRDQERSEDPMLEYMRQKRRDKEKQSGKPEIPLYKGSYPENRFGIRPGYRWDGVDRSNGYEKKYFDVQNEKKARQDEAYKYSVEDM